MKGLDDDGGGCKKKREKKSGGRKPPTTFLAWIPARRINSPDRPSSMGGERERETGRERGSTQRQG